MDKDDAAGLGVLGGGTIEKFRISLLNPTEFAATLEEEIH